MKVSYNYFIIISVISVIVSSCNTPNIDKLSSMEAKTEGVYSFPFVKADYNINSLFDDFFEYSLGIFRFRTSAESYKKDINTGKDFEKTVILSDKEIQLITDPTNNDEIDVDEVSILSGKVQISLEYSSSINAKVEYVIDDLIDSEGKVFKNTVSLEIGQNQLVSNEVDATGYSIRPRKNPNPSSPDDKSELLIGRRIITGSISINTEIIDVDIYKTILRIVKPRVEFVKGKFGNYITPISTQALSINNITSKVPNSISFGPEGHKLLIDFSNPFSIPIYIKFSELKVFYKDGSFKDLELFSTVDGGRAKNVVKLDPAIEEPDGTLSFVTRTVTFDQRNSNLPAVFSGEVKNFSYLSVNISGEINPSLLSPDKTLGKISGKVDLSANIRADIPIILNIN